MLDLKYLLLSLVFPQIIQCHDIECILANECYLSVFVSDVTPHNEAC
jgi:hypothetical protein